MRALLFFIVLWPFYCHKLRILRTFATDNSLPNGAAVYLFSSSLNMYLDEDFVASQEDSTDNLQACFVVKSWSLAAKINASYEKTTGEMQMQSCGSGLWVMGVNGGGANVTVTSKKPFGWETFGYEREGTEGVVLKRGDWYLRVIDDGHVRADVKDKALAERFLVKKMVERVEPNIYGVNVGGWLVPEKWITPSLFSAANATDQHQLCERLGAKDCERVMRTHYGSFVKPEVDFKTMKAKG